MSVDSRLDVGEIDCLVSRLVDKVRWLGVFERDELYKVTRELRPWCLILNTNPKDKLGTDWLALYAPLAGGFKLFYSFRIFTSMYSLDCLDSLNMSVSLQWLSTSVCGNYYIVYIYLRSRNHSLNDIVNLLTKISNRDLWMKENIQNLQIHLRILNSCHRIMVNIAN